MTGELPGEAETAACIIAARLNIHLGEAREAAAALGDRPSWKARQRTEKQLRDLLDYLAGEDDPGETP